MNNQNFNAGAYNIVSVLKHKFLRDDHDLSYMTKYDHEKAMEILQIKIEEFLGRELNDSEIEEFDRA